MALVKLKMVKAIPGLGDEKHTHNASFYVDKCTMVDEREAARLMSENPGHFAMVKQEEQGAQTVATFQPFAHRDLSQPRAQPVAEKPAEPEPEPRKVTRGKVK